MTSKFNGKRMARGGHAQQRMFQPETHTPRGAKPVQFAIHFQSEAAKRKVIAAAVERGLVQGKDFETAYDLVPVADAKYLKRVPCYRGLSSDLVQSIRHSQRSKRPFMPKRNPNFSTAGARRAWQQDENRHLEIA